MTFCSPVRSPILYLTVMVCPLDAGDRRLDRRIGHGGAGPQVPRPVTLAGAALLLGEDVDRDRFLAAVRLRIGGDADVGVRLDVGERGLDERHHADVVGYPDGDVAAVACLDHQAVAVDLLDLAADAHRRRALRPGRRRTGHQRQADGAGRKPDEALLHAVLP